MKLIYPYLPLDKFRTDYFFYIIPFFLFTNLIFKWEYTSTTTPDSFVYFTIAEQLPSVLNSE